MSVTGARRAEQAGPPYEGRKESVQMDGKQPASQRAETDLDDDAVGRAHTEGTRGGEDQS